MLIFWDKPVLLQTYFAFLMGLPLAFFLSRETHVVKRWLIPRHAPEPLKGVNSLHQELMHTAV